MYSEWNYVVLFSLLPLEEFTEAPEKDSTNRKKKEEGECKRQWCKIQKHFGIGFVRPICMPDSWTLSTPVFIVLLG